MRPDDGAAFGVIGTDGHRTRPYIPLARRTEPRAPTCVRRDVTVRYHAPVSA